jgi:glutamate racemase
MKESPIGIFDSGIGGLTVAYAIKKKLPRESIIYFGDTKHLPYGEKSSSVIQDFSKKITEFLINNKCKAIVIACNSASSVAFNKIKIDNATIPVFNVIDPVINEIHNLINKKNIGVIGTKTTIESKVYNRKIRKKNKKTKVSALATPLLAPMIEEGFINNDISNTIISNYLSNPKILNIDYLILACTHYPLIHKKIEDFYKNKVTVIDSTNIIANHISNELNKKRLLSDTNFKKYSFYVSNYTKSFEKSAKFFFKENIVLEEINLFP